MQSWPVELRRVGLSGWRAVAESAFGTRVGEEQAVVRYPFSLFESP